MKKSDFSRDLSDLPAVEEMDITSYLVLHTSYYTASQMKAYKSLEAFNYFVCGWVNDLGTKEALNKCRLVFARPPAPPQATCPPLKPPAPPQATCPPLKPPAPPSSHLLPLKTNLLSPAIRTNLVQYPRTPTEEKDFPHDASAITKVQLTAKLKQIRRKYRQAVDLGRRSGQGRVVLMFFELCEEILGGSPATRSLSSGIETGDLEESSSGPSSTPSLEHSPQPESSEPSGSLPAAVVVRHRRDLLQLNGHRSDRLKRKLPADHAVQEDLKIKNGGWWN
ncbi:Serine--tRNA ligase [Dissostichus eleginoides]|uniref:Serine--tRNA ligase n=1 Tax=Dissostichus eleginoides TaxID=100907 RepID=A0AAD9BW36_DISEL|nr:Serine--tRNA ligase [Dissostichus eleginoides]